MISLCTQGLTLGIDFKGGSSITLQTDRNLSQSTIRKDLKELRSTLEMISKLSNLIFDWVSKQFVVS